MSEMSLGGVLYTKSQLVDIFNTPVRGNGAMPPGPKESEGSRERRI